MRASMAIPGVFTPVRMGDMVLLDGGLRNNYPADVARDMGADIVIGISVQDLMTQSEDINDVGAVMGQLISINSRNKFTDNIKKESTKDLLKAGLYQRKRIQRFRKSMKVP